MSIKTRILHKILEWEAKTAERTISNIVQFRKEVKDLDLTAIEGCECGCNPEEESE